MGMQFWISAPLVILAFITSYLLGVYIALYIPYIKDHDFHVVTFATATGLIGGTLCTYII